MGPQKSVSILKKPATKAEIFSFKYGLSATVSLGNWCKILCFSKGTREKNSVPLLLQKCSWSTERWLGSLKIICQFWETKETLFQGSQFLLRP